ncbi:hypothetical protein ACP70R_025934 [Stipagrostis hirtigluma subsp. patula]
MSSPPANRKRARPAPLSDRRRRATTDATGDCDESPLASLPEEMIRLIGLRVMAGDFLDYVRFRAACRSWRSSTDCPRGRGVADPRFHPRGWTMLPERHGLHPGRCRRRGYTRFFNLSSGVVVRACLPDLREHCILGIVDGIILLQRDEDTGIRLLHPFTGDIADLPPLSTLMLYEYWSHPGATLEASMLLPSAPPPTESSR